jgi:predicted phage tail protein
MKKVYLHGALGKRFGKTWDLNVSSPGEAIAAIFANNPEVEKYLNKKQQEGVIYGIKKSGEQGFTESKEFLLSTEKDLHIFPIAQGSGGFAVSLIMTAITTAASMYISKKMAEAMERDDETLKVQTKSYMYNGKENRFTQGQNVPLGYGKLNIGTNVVSACTVNYDYNSETGKIFNFSKGLYSLIPHYHKHYRVDLGPLYSCFALNVFDGSSKYAFLDPAFQEIVKKISDGEFGATDGLYGGFESLQNQQARFVTMPEKKGDAIGGYYYYTFNYAKGVNKNFLGNFGPNGNWYPNPLSDIEGMRYAVTEANAIKSSYVCLQSIPLKENDNQAKIFYPIMFSEDPLEYLHGDQSTDNPRNAYPIQVGERWRGASKANGVGWFKLESTSVYKSIDLVSEGPVDGFSNKNGELAVFDREYKANEGNPEDLRNAKNDYLQGVFLDGTPVKEISFESELEGGVDSYNINEFDIDLGVNSEGHIGTEDQSLLEPQYLFTSYTKDVNGDLYGPRTIDSKTLKNSVPSTPFSASSTYEEGDYVEHDGEIYRVQNSYNEAFIESGDYTYDAENMENNSIIYVGEPESATFYKADQGLNEYKQFSGEYVTDTAQYQEGDKVRCKKFDYTMGYYKMGVNSDKFLGTHSKQKNYDGKQGYLLLKENTRGGPNSNSDLYIITGNNAGEGKSVAEFASGLSYYEDEFSNYANDPMIILLNPDKIPGVEDGQVKVTETTFVDVPEGGEIPEGGAVNETIITFDFPQNVVESQIDITPGGTADLAEDLWNQITINAPDDITDEAGEQVELFKNVDESGFDDIQLRRFNEENYLSHTIINPLVEEAYITLQVNELAYVYQGDEVEVEYQLGKLWTFLLAALSVYQIFKGVQEGVTLGGAAATQGTIASGATVVCAAPFPNAGACAVAGAVASTEPIKAAAFVAGGLASGVLVGVLGLILSFVLGSHRFRVGTKVENSGELWPNKARFRIKYGNEGEVLYSTDVYMYGIATSPYRKDVKIYLPPNPDQKDRTIKVYKLNRERNFVKEGEQAARYKEKMSLASVTEITPVQLNYPNSVIVGTRINAKDSPNMPQRTYNMRLKKVQVPTNYDPETRKYEGNWSGDFSPDLKWTDNPAWCLYDLISNKRFGIGKFGIKEENIDRWTLYKIAKYCDEYVPSGYSPKYKKRKLTRDGSSGDKPQFKIEGIDSNESFNSEFNYSGKQLAIFYNDSTYDSIRIHSVNKVNRTIVLEYEPEPQEFECAVQIDYPLVEPRYTLNAYIMNQENAFKLINEFAAIFRSFAYWSGGAINFFQDEKKESVMLFSNNNISEEGFSYSSTPKTSRTNSCNIKYVDRYNMYRPKIERAEDREAVKENNMIEQSIDGFGITSQAQAKRAAEFVVKSANLETEILSFKTSMLGSYLKPGDVIDVLDNKRTIGRFAGKALDIQVDEKGRNAEVLIDYPVHTYIDAYDKETWKTVTLYAPSGNETIQSLDSDTDVTDQKIVDMRATQIGEYLVYDIAEDDRTLKLYNNIYEFVEGDFTWLEALRDAKTKSGQLAVIQDDVAQDLMSIVLPKDKKAWLGGFNKEKPNPEGLLWVGSDSCGNNYIKYENGWAEGLPLFADPLLTDEEDEKIFTDSPREPWSICADNPTRDDEGNTLGNFIFVSGSEDLEKHGKWMHESGHLKNNYILQKTSIADDYLKKLKYSDGTTFMMEDSVNFAEKKQYKVINITEDSDGLFSIQALQYNVDKFDNIEKGLSIRPPNYPVIFNEGGSYNE